MGALRRSVRVDRLLNELNDDVTRQMNYLANERRNLSTGLATLCVGGGMGTATIIERV